MTKINVGCGPTNFGPDWFHIGSAQHVQHHDINLELFENNTVDLIYASHLLEYFDREQAKELLTRWFYKLVSGGTIRLSVPDFNVMSKLYQEDKIELKDILGPLYGKMYKGQELIYHKTVFDYKELSELLREVGFENVKRYDYKETDHGHIDDCSHAHLPHDPQAIASGNFTDKHTLISLNIEAKKP
jgi:predicted SAM-dependent methyltransferase